MSVEADEITRLRHVIADAVWLFDHDGTLSAVSALRGELRSRPQSFVAMRRENKNL